ncbi:MAG: adenosine kinase [Pseudomonadota bacterium]|nr:adenosine kinase [Pseudomonadota bacterium]
MKIVTLANAVTDLVVEVSEAELATLGFKSGSHQAGSPELQTKLEAMFPHAKSMPGGSLANSTYALGCLGVTTTLVSSIANDATGHAFAKGMHDVGVKTMITNFGENVQSQAGYVLVTPDGQRTFVNLPYNTRITPEIVDDFADDIIDADMLVIEGYLFIDQTDAVDRALELARENDVKIAITLAAENVVIKYHDTIAQHIEDGIDLFVANEEELEALINGAGHDEKLAQCIAQTTRVVTKGKDGCEYHNPQAKIAISAGTAPLPGKLLDTNGAGDGFLGGFLSLYDPTLSIDATNTRKALLAGALVASRVICQIGPRLDKTTYQAAVQIAKNLDLDNIN